MAPRPFLPISLVCVSLVCVPVCQCASCQTGVCIAGREAGRAGGREGGRRRAMRQAMRHAKRHAKRAHTCWCAAASSMTRHVWRGGHRTGALAGRLCGGRRPHSAPARWRKGVCLRGRALPPGGCLRLVLRAHSCRTLVCRAHTEVLSLSLPPVFLPRTHARILAGGINLGTRALSEGEECGRGRWRVCVCR